MKLRTPPPPKKYLRALWQALATDGTVLMELGEYPFSPLYGWIQDRYGVSWQLMLTDPTGNPRPFVVPNLLFGGPQAQDHAGAAGDFYVELFSEVFDGGPVIPERSTEKTMMGNRVFYPGPQPPSSSVMFSDMSLVGVWLAAMDSGVPQDSGFTPGTSLLVRCDSQDQIDALWDALSAVPEAEACGWLEDRYGLSWQIIPAELEQRLTEPALYNKLLGMKKIIIADF